MAEYGEQLTHSFIAENDLSAKQYYFVEYNTTNFGCDVPDAIGDITMGVLQNDPAALQAGTVAIAGVTKVIAGATIAAGNKVATSATGTAIVANSGDVWVAGHALTGGASGEYITIKIEGYQRVAG